MQIAEFFGHVWRLRFTTKTMILPQDFKEEVGWEGLEPSTNALKGRCSTIELPTRREGWNLDTLPQDAISKSKIFLRLLPQKLLRQQANARR